MGIFLLAWHQTYNLFFFVAPAVARPPIVEAIDEDSVNVTYVPSSKEGGYPEKFYIVYKEKGP